MRVDTKKPEECCGCTACESICPHGAIQMEADELGFLYPRIDDAKCVDCSLCVKVCQFRDDYARDKKWETPKVYAVRLKDEFELMKSQSGGAFYALAVKTLENGGVVYGAGFVDHFRVAHKRVETLDALEELRGSKYVQSDMRGICRQVKDDLRAGRSVLFSGTPCQVAGLTSYVGKRLTENLLTVDLVCHGVPSPAIWADYVNYIEKKNGQPCTAVKFRDKAFGWASHHETFSFTSGALSKITFRTLFYRHYMLRNSCHVCPYTNLQRPSDVTVGDFWGWSKISNEFSDDKGVSLVLINSEKGCDAFQRSESNLYVVESNINDCLQPQLKGPSLVNSNRDLFIKDYDERGFLYVARKYGDMGWRYKLAVTKGYVAKIIKVAIGRK